MSVLTLILAGGRGFGLNVLTAPRAKPAVPFGGKYRIIDFALSNVVNSNLSRIAVLAQFNPSSLMKHIGMGEPWGLNQRDGSEIQIWQPQRGRTDFELYRGTADAVYQNRKFIREDGSETVLILSGDHIYPQDFRELLRFHQDKQAKLTISTAPIPAEESPRFGMLSVDDHQKITAFEEKPEKSTNPIGSLGIYAFQTPYLLSLLEADALNPESSHDFGKDIIPRVVADGWAYAYPYHGYWQDIGDIQSYWQANMALLDEKPALRLDDPQWVIHTRAAEQPPATVRRPGQIIDSLVCDGCVIEGEVIHSLLSPGVRVEPGAVVRDAVVLNDAVIHAGAMVSSCILDKGVQVGAAARIGEGENNLNAAAPGILFSGITVIGKGAVIPPGVVIGRNCQIDLEVSASDFPGTVVASGSTIVKKGS